MAEKEKPKDEIWLIRKALSRPNYAIMTLLLQKSPRTTREIYSVLEKKFTRKTLIITLRELSLDLNVIQPTHIRTEKGYGLGYRLNPKLKQVIKGVQKFSKILENVREA
jgi:DNA-binding XRE family transcriptional regulator